MLHLVRSVTVQRSLIDSCYGDAKRTVPDKASNILDGSGRFDGSGIPIEVPPPKLRPVRVKSSQELSVEVVSPVIEREGREPTVTGDLGRHSLADLVYSAAVLEQRHV